MPSKEETEVGSLAIQVPRTEETEVGALGDYDGNRC